MKRLDRIHHGALVRASKSEARKHTSTSLASIFSSLTHSSGGSTASKSTVTPDAVFRPKMRSSKHASSSKSSGKRRSLPNTDANVVKAKETNRTSEPIPNVFEFLDPQQSSASLLVPPITSSVPTTPTAIPQELSSDDTQKEGLNTSIHSDSGISMPDSSSEHDDTRDGASMLDIQPRNKAQERPVSVKRRARAVPNRSRGRLDDHELTNEDELPYPEAYYLRGGNPWHPIPPSAPQPPSSYELEIEDTPDASETESGYDFWTGKLATSKVPPVYRRFTKLNHRILLHLQDEIAEMEEDLQYLDDAELRCRVAEAHATGRHIVPASRRMMPRSQRQNAIYFRRLDLISRLTIKMEQYNQALSSFQKVEQSLRGASDSSVEAYRSWLAEHQSVVGPEAKFLDHDGDLVTLTRSSFGPNFDSSSAHFVLAVAATALVLPLLAFSAIPQFFGRIIVLGIIGAAVTLFLGSSRVAEFLTPEEVGKYGSIYFLTMMLAATFMS